MSALADAAIGDDLNVPVDRNQNAAVGALALRRRWRGPLQSASVGVSTHSADAVISEDLNAPVDADQNAAVGALALPACLSAAVCLYEGLHSSLRLSA